MPPPYTSFVIGSLPDKMADTYIVDFGQIFQGPAQGAEPTVVPATGQLFPTGTAPQQGA